VLQANAANGVDTIVLPAGDYLLDGGWDLVVTNHVTITGAGAGATVIDGGGAHGVFHLMGAKQVTVSEVTIQGASGFGGIYSQESTLTIDHCTISGNVGGGITQVESTLTVDHCTIGGNSGAYGGGILGQNATLTVKDSTISGNSGSGI